MSLDISEPVYTHRGGIMWRNGEQLILLESNDVIRVRQDNGEIIYGVILDFLRDIYGNPHIIRIKTMKYSEDNSESGKVYLKKESENSYRILLIYINTPALRNAITKMKFKGKDSVELPSTVSGRVGRKYNVTDFKRKSFATSVLNLFRGIHGGKTKKGGKSKMNRRTRRNNWRNK